MKVDLASSISGQTPAELSPRAGEAAGSGSSSAVAQDRTTLSTSGAAVDSMVATAMSSPAVRQDKVDALRAQLANGSYSTDPKKIAQGIVDEAS